MRIAGADGGFIGFPQIMVSVFTCHGGCSLKHTQTAYKIHLTACSLNQKLPYRPSASTTRRTCPAHYGNIDSGTGYRCVISSLGNLAIKQMSTRPEVVEHKSVGYPQGVDLSVLNPSVNISTTKNGGEKVKVVVRVRPLLAHETGPAAVVVGAGNMICVNGATPHRQLQCRYDAVIGSEASQEGMFSHVRECTLAVLEGENSTIFAYGQTGSGKTYTMFGPDLNANGGAPPGYGKGVIPLAVADIFKGLVRSNLLPYSR